MSASRPARRGLRRALTTLAALAVCGALGIGSAAAFWSASAPSTTATTTAATLKTPAAPSVTATSSGSLTVSGTLPGGQLAGTKYSLKRNGSTTVCAPATASWSCPDNGLAAGTTYSYTLVATVGAWTATSAAGTGTTSCSTPDTFVITPGTQTVTAGVGFAVTVRRVKCDGTTNTGYTGTKTLAIAGLETSASGDSPTTSVSVSFGPAGNGGTATVTLKAVKAGTQAFTVANGGVTSNQASVTVTPAGIAAIGLTNAYSGTTPVAVDCGTDFDSSRTCTQSGNASGNTTWSATVNLYDEFGNLTSNPGAPLQVGFSTALGSTTAGVSIPTGGSSATFTTTFGILGWLFGFDDLTVAVNAGGNKALSIRIR